MAPQQPFRCRYHVTQGYDSNPLDNFGNHIYPDRHGGLDILPMNDKGIPFPAEIYPVLNGSEISIQDTDPKRGKGVKARTELDSDFIAYLKGKGLVPQGSKKVFLDTLYWHVLDVTDKDGLVDKDTFIAHAGNTGYVFSSGNPVPDSQKGVPPYPGLHLHLEMVLLDENGVLNTKKDSKGRVDPQIILNYKKMNNEFIKVINYKGTIYLGVGVENTDALKYISKIFDKEVVIRQDGTIESDIVVQ
jgi:hypothetical protein